MDIYTIIAIVLSLSAIVFFAIRWAIFLHKYLQVKKKSNKVEDAGEGGFVYTEPGMYTNVELLDKTSIHPNSIIHNEEHFGFEP